MNFSATPSNGPERSASAERPTAARAEDTPGLAHRVMDRGVGSLVRRHYPHGGTHVANGGLVPLGQAACAPALGLGSGPTGRIHSPGLALLRSVGGPDADPGMVCAALATRGHLSARCRLTWAWRPNRQWSDLAIARTTPIRDGTLLLDHPGSPSWVRQQPPSPAHRTAAWYAKPSPTFVDAIALVRRHLWLASEGFSLSAADPDIRKVPATLCTTDLSIPLPTPLELRKVQQRRRSR